MKVYFSTIDDNPEDSIVQFLKTKKLCSFNFLKISDIKILKKNKFFIFNKDSKKKDLIKILNILITDNNIINYLFVPKTFNEFNVPKNCEKIYYPIDFSKFEKFIKNYFLIKNPSYFSLFISSENMLLNKKNNKEVYLTEIESKIIKMLFEEKVIERKKLKSKILNLLPEIDTKSLDSHLSRIRKKLNEIDGGVEILSIESDAIQIKLTNQ